MPVSPWVGSFPLSLTAFLLSLARAGLGSEVDLARCLSWMDSLLLSLTASLLSLARAGLGKEVVLGRWPPALEEVALLVTSMLCLLLSFLMLLEASGASLEPLEAPIVARADMEDPPLEVLADPPLEALRAPSPVILESSSCLRLCFSLMFLFLLSSL